VIDFPFLGDICRTTPSKIVMLVVDGLGGASHPETGKSELETARLPNLDGLAGESACGLTDPVMPGITPGSGPGHMSLFGYDPVEYLIGRGVLEALGIDVELAEGDIAVRGNFCTLDPGGLVVDRRAGRIPTAESASLVELLDGIEIPGVGLSVYPVRDHRFVLVLKGEGLGDRIAETDSQEVGVPPQEATALSRDSKKTAGAVAAFVSAVRDLLGPRKTANMVLLRGFSRLPRLPDFGAAYRLNAAAVAAYPMYRGLAKLVGLKVLPTGQNFDDELDTLETYFAEHDFFFIHYKPADTAGEDGDFDAKVARLQELDARIPRLVALGADVLVVAGDHSTPAVMGAHSWHPVPLMVRSELTRGEGVAGFSERIFAAGSLGRIPATSVMMLAMAHAGKLAKFGP
jgi:2,3-bisphosphoglycerate-independent phosphoglycerate mutase